jgi:very-short-patch-repair endonuclease
MSVRELTIQSSVQRSPIAAERLERLRTKLLDLSTNNRMLSFRHPRASCLRVVDELPGLLFDSLLGGDQLFFEPVEEPSRRDLEAWYARRDQVPRAGEIGELKRPEAATWARQLGLNADYDLPVETDSFLRPDRHGDKKIQTLHYHDELDARLRKIRAAGRTAIEESGANMLYMAFGFLEWRDQSTSKAHQAPLLMLPVELQREQTRGGRYRTRVRWTNEELQPNLSLRKKLEEFNIKLPELQEDQKLESYLTDVTRAVRHKSDWLVRRYVTLGLFEFGKILLYLDLDPERWPSHAPIDGHPLVRTVLEGGDHDDAGDEGGGSSPRGGEIDHSPEAAKSRDLQLELVDRADSSQCEALETALAGKNLVVEGPPGTGKSQTITNLVAAALARGKTVLFVAEKLAALEVVRRRMRELGLGDFCLELHSHKTRKTEVLEDVADRVRAAAHARPPRDLETALARLSERRQKLSDYIDIISRPAGAFRDLTVGEALMRAGRARRKLGASVKTLEAAGLKVESAGQLNWGELADAKTRLRQFANAFDELHVDGSAYEHPWAGVSSARVLPHDSDRIASLAETWAHAAEELETKLQQAGLPEMSAAELASAPEAFGALDKLRPLARQAEELVVWIEQSLGISIPRTGEGAKAAMAIIDLAAAAPLRSFDLRNSYVLSAGSTAWLRQHSDRVRDIEDRRTRLREVFREEAFSRSADDLEEWSASLGQTNFFARFGRRWRAASQVWAECVRPAHLKAKAGEKAANFASLRQLILDDRALRSDRDVVERLGPDPHGADFNLERAISLAEWADNVRSTLPDSMGGPLMWCARAAAENLGQVKGDSRSSSLSTLAGQNIDLPKPTFWAALVGTRLSGSVQRKAVESTGDNAWQSLLTGVRVCAQSAGAVLASENAFALATDLDKQVWFGGQERPDLAGIASRSHVAASNVSLLPRWLDFDRFRRASEGRAEGNLVDAAAANRIRTESLTVSLDFLVFDFLARQAFSVSPALLSASGKTLDALREEYRSLDAQVMELRRAAIAAKLLQRRPPEGRQSGRRSDLTEMALLRHLMTLQRPNVPIRQLVARAGQALQALKPCFMMGPLSVAQYVAPGTLKFDLIIMDEASQMRPEDAIGALARGSQAIIVGDPKQLPPTSFFDRIAEGAGDDGEDDEVTLAEDSKSILELASSMFDQRLLKWHYRSRHEALIAFSNRQFYNDELIVFPSPAGQAERFGIGWNSIANGVATKGVNPIEARAVAAAAAKFLLEHPNRSLGVVAMNIKQAQRITDELAAMANSDPVLAKALAQAENEAAGEPFFVKNLENVQGDERDVIMISITYGPTAAGGRPPQYFGPINQETGWRRLNVLFTRAKERMEIFSSMRSTDVFPKEGSDRGPRSLKLFLDYAETGSLGVEPRPSGRDSDSDFEDAVFEGLRELNFDCVPQVGVANFFLDIGVKDPSSPGEFIAAIECDGAAYHSARSARDRDRLRQEILESLGWNIIRVWSTDWFRDPNGELDRVCRELKKLVALREEARVRKSETSTAVRPQAPADGSHVPASSPLRQGSLFGDQLSERPAVERQSSGISVEQARAKLIDLRERTIKDRFPNSDPAKGLLRKSLLDELLKKRPTDMDEFQSTIRLDLRQNTDGLQVKAFSDHVFDILAEIAP